MERFTISDLSSALVLFFKSEIVYPGQNYFTLDKAFFTAFLASGSITL